MYHMYLTYVIYDILLFKALVENRQKSKKDAGRFSSKHKIESMGREGENLAEQSDGIIEKMDELGTVTSEFRPCYK